MPEERLNECVLPLICYLLQQFGCVGCRIHKKDSPILLLFFLREHLGQHITQFLVPILEQLIPFIQDEHPEFIELDEPLIDEFQHSPNRADDNIAALLQIFLAIVFEGNPPYCHQQPDPLDPLPHSHLLLA